MGFASHYLAPNSVWWRGIAGKLGFTAGAATLCKEGAWGNGNAAVLTLFCNRESCTWTWTWSFSCCHWGGLPTGRNRRPLTGLSLHLPLLRVLAFCCCFCSKEIWDISPNPLPPQSISEIWRLLLTWSFCEVFLSNFPKTSPQILTTGLRCYCFI